MFNTHLEAEIAIGRIRMIKTLRDTKAVGLKTPLPPDEAIIVDVIARGIAHETAELRDTLAREKIRSSDAISVLSANIKDLRIKNKKLSDLLSQEHLDPDPGDEGRESESESPIP